MKKLLVGLASFIAVISAFCFFPSSSIFSADSPVAVNQGGTGQTSYTNGQLLIGNSTGNTLAKATLTGTTNQVNVGNGNGTITLSLPQSIGTASNVQFGSVTLPNAGALAISSAVANVLQINSATGATNRADLILNRFDLTNGFSRLLFWTAGSGRWSNGMRSGSDNFLIFDEVNSVAQLTMTNGSGISGTSSFAGSVTVGSTLTVNGGTGILLGAAGATITFKGGGNACAGTGLVMVAGVATVNTTCAKTNDIILIMKTAAGGTPTTGNPVITIVNNTSFTITGGASDTSTWSWLIQHTN